MQWIEDNRKDAAVLRLVDLSVLDVALAEGSEPLAEKVHQHNKALSDLRERFDKLAQDREELNRTDHWLNRDSKTVLAERRGALSESWDVLVTLRRLLQDRRDLLAELEELLWNRIHTVEEQHNQALDSVRKTLNRENRSYLKVEPIRGRAYVEDLAKEDQTVVGLQVQLTHLQSVQDQIQTLRHRACQCSALTIRQRELFEQLN